MKSKVETGYVTLGKQRRRENCAKGYCRCCGWKVEYRAVTLRKEGQVTNNKPKRAA